MSKKKAKKRAPRKTMTWFGPETTVPLRDQLNATLEGGARLEVRGNGRAMTLTVVPLGPTALAAFAPLNKSFVCPPICP